MDKAEEPLEGKKTDVKMIEAVVEAEEVETFIAYKYRWAMLSVFALAALSRNFQSGRFAPLTQEFAEYFNTTNEVSLPDEPGIDFIAVSGSFYSLFFFPIAGYLVAKHGLKILSLGTIFLCAGNWWYYLSFTNYSMFLFGKFLSTFGNCCIIASLLRLVSHWFPPAERSVAIAVGAMIGPIGSGMILGLAGFFKTGNEVIDISLKSCEADFIGDYNESNFDLDEETGLPLCDDDAEEAFCCFTPTKIEALNLMIALISTLAMFLAVAVVRDVPPSPVAATGKKKEGISYIASMKLLLSHMNYVILCIADMCTAGPVFLLFSTISRVTPPSVSDYASIAAAGSILFSIPCSYFVAKYLSRTQKFYELTYFGYIAGCVGFFAAAACITIGQSVTDYLFLGLMMISLSVFGIWQIAVYELKSEYVYHEDIALYGHIVATDRFITNLSGLIFVAAFPPERFEGGFISGREFTFYICGIATLIPVFLISKMPNKRDYKRMILEVEEKAGPESL
eukprot:augustus_masked-scaffold_39-processed-gene-0.31-mRNA-1 protein AED:1.00 eAED:1.00 QI:0/-1/0/0/-1/1/1/0/507